MVLDNTDLTVMEITSATVRLTALFDVQGAQANSSPAKSELIFDKYGNRYFLAKLFDEGNPSGSQVLEVALRKRKSVKRPPKARNMWRHCAGKTRGCGKGPRHAGRLLKSSLHNGFMTQEASTNSLPEAAGSRPRSEIAWPVVIGSGFSTAGRSPRLE